VSDFNSLKRSFYQRVCYCPSEPKAAELVHSDIVLHLPVIEYFASLCGHVTEFGVREGCSTAALLAGCKGEVHSYDIEHTPVVDRLRAMTLPCSWAFHLGDTGSADLPVADTSLLFVDTLHVGPHVRKELAHHGRKARKFLVFHDTFTCGERDLSGPDPTAEGILPAIREFLARFPGEYEEAYSTAANNGLLVLRRLGG
jgi:hypothetical protein